MRQTGSRGFVACGVFPLANALHTVKVEVVTDTLYPNHVTRLWRVNIQPVSEVDSDVALAVKRHDVAGHRGRQRKERRIGGGQAEPRQTQRRAEHEQRDTARIWRAPRGRRASQQPRGQRKAEKARQPWVTESGCDPIRDARGMVEIPEVQRLRPLEVVGFIGDEGQKSGDAGRSEPERNEWPTRHAASRNFQTMVSASDMMRKDILD